MNSSFVSAFAAPSLALSLLLAPSTPSTAVSVQDEEPVQLKTSSCLVLEGQHVAIVTTTNGLVRRVELETFEATAEAREHEGARRIARVREVEGGRLVTLDFEGNGYLRSSETLQPLGRFSVGSGYGMSVIGPAGRTIARVRNRREVAVSTRSEERVKPLVLKCSSDIQDLAYSADGKQLVALVQNGYRFIDQGKLGELITLPVGFEPRMIEFIGGSKLAVGSGGDNLDAPVQVLIMDARSGAQERVIEAPFQAAPLGGFISSLEFHPESGRLIFGISSAGSVLAVDPDTGEFFWEINFGGGNPGGIGVVHPRGSKRCFSRGMTDSHRAAFSWDTGKMLSGDRLHGYSYLTGTTDDRYTIGIENDRLIRVDSESYHPEWRRIERSKPLSGSVAVFSKPR